MHQEKYQQNKKRHLSDTEACKSDAERAVAYPSQANIWNPCNKNIKQFDYDSARRTYKRNTIYYASFIKNAKQSTGESPFPFFLHLKPLNSEQRECMKGVKELVKNAQAGKHGLCIVDGQGGCGKSLLIITIGHLLTEKNIPFRIASPIAVAAYPFKASTIHNLLGLYNCKQPYKTLLHQDVHPATRKVIRDLQVLLIDEIYVCGANLFSLLIERIKWIKAKKDGLPLSIICVGDKSQHLCCMDTLLFSQIRDDLDAHIKTALQLFQNPDFQYELRKSVRQISDSIFQGILTRLHDDETTENDVRILETRLSSKISDDELDKFVDSVHLFSSNRLCDEWNNIYLMNEEIPCVNIKPVTEPECDECASQLPSCKLGRGVKVLLLRNFIVNRGLCNGCELEIVDVFYASKEQKLPEFVTFKPKNYQGPVLSEDGSVPLSPLTENIRCVHQDKILKVSYYPLKNSYGRTTHRIQSATLDSVVITLQGFKYRDRGLYVALSRVRSLDKLVIFTDRPLKSYFFKENNGIA